MPEWESKDEAITFVEANLSITDRLRVLFFGRFNMQVRVVTENVIGRTSSESLFIPPRFRWRKQPPGYIAVEDKADD
jgi:hypothetical protein